MRTRPAIGWGRDVPPGGRSPPSMHFNTPTFDCNHFFLSFSFPLYLLELSQNLKTSCLQDLQFWLYICVKRGANGSRSMKENSVSQWLVWYSSFCCLEGIIIIVKRNVWKLDQRLLIFQGTTLWVGAFYCRMTIEGIYLSSQQYRLYTCSNTIIIESKNCKTKTINSLTDLLFRGSELLVLNNWVAHVYVSTNQ